GEHLGDERERDSAREGRLEERHRHVEEVVVALGETRELLRDRGRTARELHRREDAVRVDGLEMAERDRGDGKAPERHREREGRLLAAARDPALDERGGDDERAHVHTALEAPTGPRGEEAE